MDSVGRHLDHTCSTTMRYSTKDIGSWLDVNNAEFIAYETYAVYNV